MCRHVVIKIQNMMKRWSLSPPLDYSQLLFFSSSSILAPHLLVQAWSRCCWREGRIKEEQESSDWACDSSSTWTWLLLKADSIEEHINGLFWEPAHLLGIGYLKFSGPGSFCPDWFPMVSLAPNSLAVPPLILSAALLERISDASSLKISHQCPMAYPQEVHTCC